MNRKDYLLIALVPAALLLLPFIGSLTVEGWNWTWSDFLFAWIIFTTTTAFFRFLVRQSAGSLAYQVGAALAVLTGFLIIWVTLAVQIIGDDNPGNSLYLLTILGGFIGVLVARFQAGGLMRVAFAMAAALSLIPFVAHLRWPSDFSPGYLHIQLASLGLAAMFVISGLLFRRAARLAQT